MGVRPYERNHLKTCNSSPFIHKLIINYKNMNVRLLGDRVLLELKKEEEKTTSGFLVKSEKQQGDIFEGVIVKVGGGKRGKDGEFIPVDLKENDKVLFNYGQSVKIEGKPYLLVNEADVLMVI